MEVLDSIVKCEDIVLKDYYDKKDTRKILELVYSSRDLIKKYKVHVIGSQKLDLGEVVRFSFEMEDYDVLNQIVDRGYYCNVKYESFINFVIRLGNIDINIIDGLDLATKKRLMDYKHCTDKYLI